MKSRTDGKGPKPKPDDEEQSKKFIEKARELEANETETSFERAMSIIRDTPDAERQKSRHEEISKVAGKVKKD